MAESKQDVVELHDIDAPSLKQLIDFAYTGEIIITEENVQVLLPASSLLQIQSVREACCKFLLRQLHPSNVLGIRSFAGRKIVTIIQLLVPSPISQSNRFFPICNGKFSSDRKIALSFSSIFIIELGFNYRRPLRAKS